MAKPQAELAWRVGTRIVKGDLFNSEVKKKKY